MRRSPSAMLQKAGRMREGKTHVARSDATPFAPSVDSTFQTGSAACERLAFLLRVAKWFFSMGILGTALIFSNK